MWTVELAAEFEPELRALTAEVRVELLAQARIIERFGPTANRPRVDTLNGSKHANMKELRFDADGGVWRVAFALDPERNAILLVAASPLTRSSYHAGDDFRKMQANRAAQLARSGAGKPA